MIRIHVGSLFMASTKVLPRTTRCQSIADGEVAFVALKTPVHRFDRGLTAETDFPELTVSQDQLRMRY